MALARSGSKARRGRLCFQALTLLTILAAPTSASAATQASGAAALRALVEVADIDSLAASADRRMVAFRVQSPSVLGNSYRIDWYVADVEAGRSRRVGDGGEPIYNNGVVETEPPVWSPDGRFFYHRLLVDGAIGLWRTAADGSGSRQVVGGDSDVESLAAAPDGGSLIYVTGPTRDEIRRAERREYDNGILVDERVDMSQTMFRGGWVHGRLGSQRLIGRWYSREGLLQSAPRTRHRLDMRTLVSISQPEPVRLVEPLRAAAAPPPLRAAAANGDIATAAGEEASRTLSVRRSDGVTIACPATSCRNARIVTLTWRPGQDAILFTTTDPHFRQSLHMWTLDSGRLRRIARGNGLLSGGRHPYTPCAATAEALICVAAGAASPPQVVQIDLDSGERAVLFDPNAALREHEAPKLEHLTWRLADGRRASGTLFFPPRRAHARAPLFLTYYYCYGYLRGGVGDEFPLLSLVEAGFVVGCLNIVPYPRTVDGVDLYRAAQASVESLLDLLDRARVGMGGFSAGSEAAMWIAMNTNLLAAASISSPPYEPSAYWMGAMRGRDNPRVMREFMGAGPPDEDHQRWRLFSPALNVHRISAPLLMQFPEQEVRHAAEFHARLSNTPTPVEMYAFPEEAHIKIQPRHRYSVHQRNLDWFRYWLQNHVDPDPTCADQYRRWDDLRRRQKGSAGK